MTGSLNWKPLKRWIEFKFQCKLNIEKHVLGQEVGECKLPQFPFSGTDLSAEPMMTALVSTKLEFCEGFISKFEFNGALRNFSISTSILELEFRECA